jgi:carbohydrate-binding DOMON domain-containing protein
MLSHAEIKASNSGSRNVVTRVDPAGDDLGTGSYVYPTTPQLRSGSLDLTRFGVSVDSVNVYFSLWFRNLSDPGWHPEYGFQLTYVAIAIDADRRRSSGQRNLGWNSNVILDNDAGYERLILVGGGVRILDANDSILAEYLPAPGDERNPLGDAPKRTISFAIPQEVLGEPSAAWRFAVFVGAQDDHGGAGLGEFRTVGDSASAWVGGGKRRTLDANVYDTLVIE